MNWSFNYPSPPPCVVKVNGLSPVIHFLDVAIDTWEDDEIRAAGWTYIFTERQCEENGITIKQDIIQMYWSRTQYFPKMKNPLIIDCVLDLPGYGKVTIEGDCVNLYQYFKSWPYLQMQRQLRQPPGFYENTRYVRVPNQWSS